MSTPEGERNSFAEGEGLLGPNDRLGPSEERGVPGNGDLRKDADWPEKAAFTGTTRSSGATAPSAFGLRCAGGPRDSHRGPGDRQRRAVRRRSGTAARESKKESSISARSQVFASRPGRVCTLRLSSQTVEGPVAETSSGGLWSVTAFIAVVVGSRSRPGPRMRTTLNLSTALRTSPWLRAWITSRRSVTGVTSSRARGNHVRRIIWKAGCLETCTSGLGLGPGCNSLAYTTWPCRAWSG